MAGFISKEGKRKKKKKKKNKKKRKKNYFRGRKACKEEQHSSMVES
jgi:hypothetical protein